MNELLRQLVGWGSASVKLGRVLSRTALHCARLNIRSGFRPDAASGAEATQAWAREMCRTVGVCITRRGSPISQPALYVANHRSYIDIIAMAAQLETSYVAKASVAKWPVIGYAARLANTIFVERDDRRSRAQTRTQIARALKAGQSVTVFAEGTTAAGPEILPLRQGVFQIAVEADVPVVPVAIDYPDRRDAWVGDATFVGHFLQRFSRSTVPMHITFCSPLRDRDAKWLQLATTRAIERAIARASGRHLVTLENHQHGGLEDGEVTIPDRASRTSRSVAG